MAISPFGRAYQAEQARALPVDEERHHRVFLGFPLTGAADAEEPPAETCSLLERTTPREALGRLLQLAFNRVRDDLPPRTRLDSGIQLLVWAAGMDQNEVEQ